VSTIFSIHLWRDDRHEDYCGCWHVAVSDDDAVVATLREAGFGCFRNEDGSIGRAFFLADELGEQMSEAESVTECFVEATACNRPLGAS
jgi:hypothetical protein